MNAIPHAIPYQGSKRHLASRICALMPDNIDTLYEPFAGSAAVSIYAATQQIGRHYIISDALEPLAQLWEEIINRPDKTARHYQEIWDGHVEGPEYFLKIRERFNKEKGPIDLLYLIVRCVKNAIRFNRHGDFTQSADKRRKGTQPQRMRNSIEAISHLLKGKTTIRSGDFRNTIQDVGVNDFVYMDPPYHGTTYGRDKRYITGLTREDLVEGLKFLNQANTPFILSYDGKTGDTEYGEKLPDFLKMEQLWIAGGRSSQATLAGRSEQTIESLYLSNHLVHHAKNWCQDKGLIQEEVT